VMSDFLGSLAAIMAGAVVYFTGWLPIDAILSLFIAVLILATSLKLLRDALHVLMEGVPGPYELGEIGHALARIEGVHSVHDLHVWSIASNQIALSAHLRVKNLSDWPATLVAAQACMHDDFGIDHVTLQPEMEQTPAPATAVVRLWLDRAH
jgi:cobalt-zinc-cadmium efflux system protein